MTIIDTSPEIPSAFEAGRFDLARWGAYMDKSLPGVRELCLADMRECIHAGCSWEGDYLPVLNAVASKPGKRAEALLSFSALSGGLDEQIARALGRSVDTALVLYLGLCNGAGWVTETNGRTLVLLGIEKIIELDWCGVDDMRGLLLHELGHVYQAQYGVLHRDCASDADRFLWQLFTEGIAMVFEQLVVGDADYYHQDKNGWKRWCDGHAAQIRASFAAELPALRFETQHYFGDWVSYEGRGDVGYYLGARFVRFLMEEAPFDALISWDLPEVWRGFTRFLDSPL